MLRQCKKRNKSTPSLLFHEALFLKAQILWQGFEDREAAKHCLLKIIKTEPDKEAVFHRWALNLYREIQKHEKKGKA